MYCGEPGMEHTIKGRILRILKPSSDLSYTRTVQHEDVPTELGMYFHESANSKASTLRLHSTTRESPNDMDTFATHEHVEGQKLTGLAGRGIDRSVPVKSGLTKGIGLVLDIETEETRGE